MDSQTNHPHYLVVGVGGCGCRITQILQNSHLPPILDFLYIDREDTPVYPMGTASFLPVPNHHMTTARGDIINAAKDAELVIAVMQNTAMTYQLVVVIAGFGGGMGSGATPVISRFFKSSGSIVITAYVRADPNHDGKKKCLISDMAVDHIAETSDTILCLNETLSKNQSVKENETNEYIEPLVSLIYLMTETSANSVHSSVLRDLLQNGRHCYFGTVTATGSARVDEIKSKLMAIPWIHTLKEIRVRMYLNIYSQQPRIQDLDVLTGAIISQWNEELDLIFNIHDVRNKEDKMEISLLVFPVREQSSAVTRQPSMTAYKPQQDQTSRVQRGRSAEQVY